MTAYLLGVASGVAIGLILALITRHLDRRREKRRRTEQGRFSVYMQLLGIHAWYFWVATAEMHNEPLSGQLVRELRDSCLKIADQLRELDDLPEAPEILDALFKEGAASTAAERQEILRKLVDRVGDRVNPRFARRMKEIGDANLLLLLDPRSRTAPARLSSGPREPRSDVTR